MKQSRIYKLSALLLLMSGLLFLPAGRAQKNAAPQIPRTWDDAALAEWETPVAGLNQRPQHISEKEYYALTVENLRTYPVYLPGREPEGYWEKLQKAGPMPLIEPEKLQTESAWIEAGRRVFEEADHIHLRTLDPKFVMAARNQETFDKARMQALPDGTVFGMRWVPTRQGVALTFNNCSNCHLSYRANGMRIDGAPASAEVSRTRDFVYRTPLIGQVQLDGHIVTGATPFRMGAEPLGMWLYRAYGVPWLKDDPNERMKTLTQAEYIPWIGGFANGGAVPRWNGSLYYPAKMPDLIGIKDRKYFDHTGTHLHRGIGDLMRYAAQVSYAETTEFGPHRVLAPDSKRVQARLPDEALYALALYLYSLKPPPNPNPYDEKAKVGEQIFTRTGCVNCHTPPLYTNNKLTLAEGFTPPKDAHKSLDVLPLSVGTDAGLALKTRKGTGYYKVPSLKGVWYRGHYLHDGSLASLEEMFNPERLKETFTPDGWSLPGVKARAVKGHEFGLKLSAEERAALIAFLRTL